MVEAVANHLGVFDHAVGTGSPGTGGLNLSRAAKAGWLTARYGARGYDYVGDDKVDLPVWAEARRALVVRPGSGVEAAAAQAGIALEVLGQKSEPLTAWLRPRLRALRPHQWTKNLLVFIPVLAAHQSSGLAAALLAFVTFSLMASAVYIVNDLTYLAADRAHPRKRRRPFAAGLIPVGQGLVMAGGWSGRCSSRSNPCRMQAPI